MTEDATALSRWFDEYVPEYAPERYAPLIRQAVRRTGPATLKAARMAAGMLSGLVLWADETGLEVTAEVLFDRDVIDRYVAREMGPLGYAPSSRVSAHWQFRVLALANGSPTPVLGAGQAYRVPRADPRPYTAADVDGFLTWADAMPNPINRHGLLAVLAATLGAGLRSRDLVPLPGTCITSGRPPGTVRVTVSGGTHPRTVTVLDRYAHLLHLVGRAAGARWVVRPDRTGTQPLLTTAVNSMIRDPRLSVLTASRCRATWVCGHLAAGTRLDVLVEAGGFSSTEGLQLFLSGIPETTPDRAVALLREPRRGQPRPRVPTLRDGDRT